MDNSSSWDNTINPVENRLSNYMLASSGGNISSTNAANSRAQSGWDRGESSSSANNLQDQTCLDDSKMRLGWSSSVGPCPGTVESTENWSFEPSDFSNTSYVGNQVSSRSSNMQNYSSNRGSLSVISNHGHARENDGHRILGAGLPHTLYKSGQSEGEQIPNFYASPSIGASSGSSSTFFEINNSSSPSLGPWGSSCKRKTLEGTSGQFYPGGSSSSNQPVENIKQHPIPGCCTAPGNISISSEPLNLSQTNRTEHLNSRSGVGMSRVTPAVFPSSSVPGIAESSGRNLSVRSNTRHHDSVRFDTPRGTSVRHSSAYAAQQLPRPFSSSDSPELRSPIALPINPSNTQSHLMHVSEERGMHSYPWNGSFSSQGGSSSSSFVISGERGSAVHEEGNARSSLRNNPEFSMFVSAPETRNAPQDQIDWSFAPGTSASSRNHSSASRVGPGSGGRASPIIWLPHQIQTSQTRQRLSEFAPWNPVPHIESDSGVRRSHFVPFPSASFSADEATTISRAQHQSDQRSPAFLMDIPSDDINGWRAFAAVDGRHRLIRQVLNAMRRGVHLQPEDYMLIDPFINGFAELHDRHRDMRLDVDNMSYEELLALEDRIGNVNTGLSEEKILGSMKQRKHGAMGVSLNLEPCCICQEDYIDGDDIGISDCGHEFHINCIKQWLTQKNLCPICKTTALAMSFGGRA